MNIYIYNYTFIHSSSLMKFVEPEKPTEHKPSTKWWVEKKWVIKSLMDITNHVHLYSILSSIYFINRIIQILYCMPLVIVLLLKPSINQWLKLPIKLSNDLLKFFFKKNCFEKYEEKPEKISFAKIHSIYFILYSIERSFGSRNH